MEEAAAGDAGALPCDRCGDFAPLRRIGARSLCDACFETGIHPVLRGPATVGGVLSGPLRLYREVGLPIVGMHVVAGAFVKGLDLVLATPIALFESNRERRCRRARSA